MVLLMHPTRRKGEDDSQLREARTFAEVQITLKKLHSAKGPMKLCLIHRLLEDSLSLGGDGRRVEMDPNHWFGGSAPFVSWPNG